MAFQKEIDNKESVAVVKLSSRLDALNCKQLLKDFESRLKQTGRFVFDCAALDFIDSSGLGAIVTCLRKAEAAGGSLRLAGLGPQAKMVFEVTRAQTLFASYGTVEEAAVSFRQ